MRKRTGGQTAAGGGSSWAETDRRTICLEDEKDYMLSPFAPFLHFNFEMDIMRSYTRWARGGKGEIPISYVVAYAQFLGLFTVASPPGRPTPRPTMHEIEIKSFSVFLVLAKDMAATSERTYTDEGMNERSRTLTGN